MSTQQITHQDYDDFRRYLEEASGIVLGDNKHYLVTSRLNRLMREFEIENFAQLMRRLKTERKSKLHEQIVDAMTTNETLWFRDNYPFEVLKHVIFPEYSQKRLSQLRIWSAASSTGQEAYSISMSIQEYLASKPGSLPANIQIIGTDLSATVLKEASAASYEAMSLARGISEERRKRFFTERNGKFEVRPEIKARASFRELNLMHNYASLGKFDIVFCRNVLIYFSSAMKTDILNRIAKSLNPGGYLFLGGSESPTSYTDAFELLRTPKGVVYRVKDAALGKPDAFGVRK
ncbi:MAG: protein-glutamate O-methyltransferase CheR [Chromatiales bacterium]|nr:protein-glutamate O-methyltransferase CheR [Gammaproteobacteria bacterium]MBW6476643.1 protein-glutamate O-methyltransferase CheR [Chromatiales bacterium]